jgi:hypothetical protein
MVENIYAKLYPTCFKISKDKIVIFEALQLCWSFIDSIHRIREMLQAIPRLNKKDNRLKLFLTNTELTKTFRNYIQHLRIESSKQENDKFPVMGSLSWVDQNDPMKCHSIIIGTEIKDVSYSYCEYDKETEKWVSNVSLSIFNYSYNFDLIFIELKKYMIDFFKWLDDNNHRISTTIINPIIATLEIKQKLGSKSKFEKTIVYSLNQL